MMITRSRVVFLPPALPMYQEFLSLVVETMMNELPILRCSEVPDEQAEVLADDELHLFVELPQDSGQVGIFIPRGLWLYNDRN